MSASPDLYGVLGVARKATADEIKRAYRARAREFHPDRNPGDAEAEARFKQVTVAYEILSDPVRRAQYDRFGRVLSGRGAGAEGDLGEVFDRLFREVFGANPFRRDGTSRGDDLRYTVTVTLEEAARGVEKEISYRRKEACPRCAGSGASTALGQTLCPACGGSGEDRASGRLLRRGRCGRCRGSGYLPSAPCAPCAGRGLVDADLSLKVKVPAGVDTGQQLQVRGKGNRGRGADNREAGDLLVVVNVREHAFFKRHGLDVHCELPLTFAEAAAGADLEVPTLDGPTTIRIPPGTQPAAVFTLRGRGLPPLRGGRRGDLHVRAVLEVPSVLPPEAMALLRDLAPHLAGGGEARRRWREALEGGG
ncbi:J domain-containing protein [Myxococcota bacterium]|nr:J domain-containing protein [Myxococcota bacterium]